MGPFVWAPLPRPGLGHLSGPMFGARPNLGPFVWDPFPFGPIIDPKSTQNRSRRKVVATSSQLRRRLCVDRLSRQALACLAYLASDRPRSPCLHQQQQQRRSAPPGRRRRPGCCCEVQARRARPIRGEVSQTSQGQVREPTWPGPGPFIWPRALYLGPGPLGDPLFGDPGDPGIDHTIGNSTLLFLTTVCFLTSGF